MTGTTATVFCTPTILKSQIANPYSLNVAAIFPSTRSYQIIHQDTIRMALRGDIHYEYYDQVPAEEYESILRNVSEKNFDLIITDSDEQFDIVVNTLPDFPSNAYLLRSTKQPLENHARTATFNQYVYESSYLSGILAIGVSQSKTLGFIGSLFSPSSNRNINAFIQGAKEVDPDVRVIVDLLDTEATPGLINQKIEFQTSEGVDLIYCENVGSEKFVAAQNINFIGNLFDHYEEFPTLQISSTLWHFSPILHQATQRIRNNIFQTDNLDNYSGLRFGGCSLAPLRESIVKVQEDVLERVTRRLIEITNNNFIIANVEVEPESDY